MQTKRTLSRRALALIQIWASEPKVLLSHVLSSLSRLTPVSRHCRIAPTERAQKVLLPWDVTLAVSRSLVRQSIALYKGDVKVVYCQYAESENHPTHGTGQTSDCGPAGLLCSLLGQRNDPLCVEESITRDRTAGPQPITPQKVGQFIPRLERRGLSWPLTVMQRRIF